MTPSFLSVLLPVSTIPLLTLALALRRDAKRRGASLGALAVAVAGLGAGIGWAWSASARAVHAVSGESVDPVARHHELVAAFTRTDPIARWTLVGGAIALTLGCAALFLEWWKLGGVGRVLGLGVAALAASLLFPARAMAHRAERVHRETLQGLLSADHLRASSPERCDNLEEALQVAHGLGDVEAIVPDARARARACIAERLACIDAGGPCAEEMAGRVEVYNQLHPKHHTTPLRAFVASSSMLIDPAQKADVSERIARAGAAR